MDKSKSYAEITTPNNYQNVVNDWPELKNQSKSQIKQKEPVNSANQSDPENQEVNTLTNAIQRLSTVDRLQTTEVVGEQKSRDDIRAERRIRRKNDKLKKKDEHLQQKITQIREPKSQKIQIVDKAALDTYVNSRKLSPVRDRQRKFKSHSTVKIDLLDLINTKIVRPIDRSSIQSRQTGKLTSSTQRHKGKKSEVLKKKYVSPLKRSILSSRLLRNQLKSEATSQPHDVDSDLKDTDSNNVDPKRLDDKPTTLNELPSIEPTGFQFSRKFRPYCDNLTSTELLSITKALLSDIFRFQDRAYNKNEVKARSQRRFVVGFKESMRQLDIGKVKLLIIAPDLETGGDIAETIEEMKTKCQKLEIPYVFSLKRRQLGYVLLKKVPISCVGILNYQGSEENSQKLLLLIQEERLRFRAAVSSRK
ncbi:selenocysteine insertion sequence-binding protein 2 [Bradysia coprophila]|uniref:selenocysteine insertion sequence-binding protein 2 n=1 Tax=Bradysia coprophila TaxID=38358 RepID=UPI00187D94A7|nr:selenocysteine insertion sequence-binding protein 2 [Bradysia coprophila]